MLSGTEVEARSVPRARLDLVRCEECGLIRNVAFDPHLVDYSADYDSSQWSSPVFRRFGERLARDLVGRHDLVGRSVLEVGCGKGELLVLLRAAGVARVVGVDPSFPPDQLDDLPDGVEVIIERYSSNHSGLSADAVVCRQTLEHLEDPLGLLRVLRGHLAEGSGVLYVDVPDAAAVFRGSSTWDLIYPHVNYFELVTLERLVDGAGFDVLASGRALDDQFAYVEATPRRAGARHGPLEGARRGPLEGAGGSRRADSATATFERRLVEGRELLRAHRSKGERVALWGAGSRGVTFLNLVDVDRVVGAVVDLSPAKQGRYLPGTGHRVGAPDELRRFRPDVVLMTNPIYREEVAGMLLALEVAVPVEVV